jgi:hypothetical protein
VITEYVLKGGEAEYARVGGDYYETRKFWGRRDVMLSESIFSVIEGRRSIGVRRLKDNEKRSKTISF